MPNWITEGYIEYAKRLPANFQLKLIEVAISKRAAHTNLKKNLAEESEQILAAIPKNSFIIALDEHGVVWDTLKLAKNMQTWQEAYHEISLLVGGPDGLAPECKMRANAIWSLSPLTLPHPLVRIVVAEQIYRAWTILQNHPYHRN